MIQAYPKAPYPERLAECPERNIMYLMALLQSAQQKLRATQENWHEVCLFECDELLTNAIKELSAQQQNAVDRLRADVASDEVASAIGN